MISNRDYIEDRMPVYEVSKTGQWTLRHVGYGLVARRYGGLARNPDASLHLAPRWTVDSPGADDGPLIALVRGPGNYSSRSGLTGASFVKGQDVVIPIQGGWAFLANSVWAETWTHHPRSGSIAPPSSPPHAVWEAWDKERFFVLSASEVLSDDMLLKYFERAYNIIHRVPPRSFLKRLIDTMFQSPLPGCRFCQSCLSEAKAKIPHIKGYADMAKLMKMYFEKPTHESVDALLEKGQFNKGVWYWSPSSEEMLRRITLNPDRYLDAQDVFISMIEI